MVFYSVENMWEIVKMSLKELAKLYVDKEDRKMVQGKRNIYLPVDRRKEIII